MSDFKTDKSARSFKEKEGKRREHWEKKAMRGVNQYGAENYEREARENHNSRFNRYQEMKKSSMVCDDSIESKRRRTKDDYTSHHFEGSFRDSNISSGSSSVISHDSPQCKKQPRKPVEIETDPVILARRQKQIDYGKNTVGYDLYCKAVPKDRRTHTHPRTPPKHVKFSRRNWDSKVKIWRQKLHAWDIEEKDKSPEEKNLQRG